MLRPRITPCLLIHEGGLVKTKKFKAPQYVGDPINAVRIFNEKEADELIILDIDAAVNSADPDFKLIANLAAECRMPLCYGGGIKTVEQAKRIISLGVEKVALSSAAVASSDLITEISDAVGKQSVTVIVDVKKKMLGDAYDVYTHNASIKTGISALDFAETVETAGAGEIIFNSIDRDGTMAGYDLNLARLLRSQAKVPISLLGGAGSLRDFSELIENVGVIGASAGSLFVFKGKYRAVLINYPPPSEKEALIQKAMRTWAASTSVSGRSDSGSLYNEEKDF